MRDYEYLPYEKAVEKMAKEYAKVRPMNIKAKNSSVNKSKEVNECHLLLQNVYMDLLESMMLINRLPWRRRDRDIEIYKALLALKQDSIKCIQKIYFKEFPRPYSSPVVKRMPLTEVVNKLKSIETAMLSNINKLVIDYPSTKYAIKSEESAYMIIEDLLELYQLS